MGLIATTALAPPCSAANPILFMSVTLGEFYPYGYLNGIFDRPCNFFHKSGISTNIVAIPEGMRATNINLRL